MIQKKEIDILSKVQLHYYINKDGNLHSINILPRQNVIFLEGAEIKESKEYVTIRIKK